MTIPMVLSLPLEEAVRRLQAQGLEYECKVLLPPRDSEADFEGKAVRKYIARQEMNGNKVALTIVYRTRKEV